MNIRTYTAKYSDGSILQIEAAGVREAVREGSKLLNATVNGPFIRAIEENFSKNLDGDIEHLRVLRDARQGICDVYKHIDDVINHNERN
jgi:hypothetical protein